MTNVEFSPEEIRTMYREGHLSHKPEITSFPPYEKIYKETTFPNDESGLAIDWAVNGNQDPLV